MASSLAFRRREEIMRGAAALYLLSEAQKKYRQFAEVSPVSRLGDADRQAVYRLAWLEEDTK